MHIDVFFTPGEAGERELDGSVAVVIDVLRATSTMVEALANGARAIYPMQSVEDALRLAASLGRDQVLLCGERRGRKIDGFDLGNSPEEFTEARVRDHALVMTTTNGTRALLSAEAADRVVAASFLNLAAVAGSVQATDRLVVVCAGRQDLFSLEDAVCAGHLIRCLAEPAKDDLSLNDAAMAATRLAGAVKPTSRFLAATAGGQALSAIGLAGDLKHVAQVDRHGVVPEMRDRVVQLGP